jgi:diguanylate cyclase (GGDEF)-like protein
MGRLKTGGEPMTELSQVETNALHILVFEDRAMDAALIKKFLRTVGVRGAHIYHADTIPSALQVMTHSPIDLCLADYHLQPNTGVDLMEEARRNNMDVPFIVITAIDDRSVDEEVLAHGAYDFLVKGDLTVEGLDRSIRYAISSHRRERALTRAAYFDPLTGLPNRLSFLEQLSQAVTDNRATGGLIGVALINLDGTKLINTRLGHNIGDNVLKAAAARLEPEKSETDFLARIGGDEFGLLMNDVLLASHALATTRSLAEAVTGPVETGLGAHVITATCGVAVREIKKSDNPAGIAQKLLLSATHAMFDAKVSGRRHGTSNVALARVH